MTILTIADASRHTRLSEPTLRYYEEVGLIGPIARDPQSGHRRYTEADLDNLQALACLRAMGVGIEDMRTYQSNRARGRAAAGEQRDLLTRHAHRIEHEITTLNVHLAYLEAKAALWDARDQADPVAEAIAFERVQAMLGELEAVLTPRESTPQPASEGSGSRPARSRSAGSRPVSSRPVVRPELAEALS